MGAEQRRPGAAQRFRLVTFLLLAFAALSGVGAQQLSDVSVYLQDEAVEEGSGFYLYIEIPREYAQDFYIIRPDSHDRMRYYSGPAFQSSLSADIPEDRVRYRYRYVADEAGYTQMGSFTLSPGASPTAPFDRAPLARPQN